MITMYKYTKGGKHQEELRATDVIENGCTITNMYKLNDYICGNKGALWKYFKVQIVMKYAF